MIRLRWVCLSLLLMVSILAGQEKALADNYKIDTSHSSVSFKIKHLVSYTRGSFTDFEGMIEYNPESMSDSKVRAVIQTTSINTANENRDKHLRSADFFEVETYPEIIFQSTSVGNGILAGKLTMHGVTRPIELSLEEYGVGLDHHGVNRAGFFAKGELDRKDFGILYNKVLDHGGLVLGETIFIEIEIEAIALEELKEL